MMPPHLRPALLTAFEAARQASRGLYQPEPALAEALAFLAERGPRAGCVALWNACTKHHKTSASITTANHLRGLRAMEAWRTIAAGMNVELTRDVLLGFYAESREPDERHAQALAVPVWRGGAQ